MNIIDNMPDDLSEELIETLLEKDNLRIERIVSRGHVSSEWYDQDSDEFVLLVQGEAKLLFEQGNREVYLRAGDYIFIPAHERHKVTWTPPTSNTIWFAVHYGDQNYNIT